MNSAVVVDEAAVAVDVHWRTGLALVSSHHDSGTIIALLSLLGPLEKCGALVRRSYDES